MIWDACLLSTICLHALVGWVTLGGKVPWCVVREAFTLVQCIIFLGIDRDGAEPSVGMRGLYMGVELCPPCLPPPMPVLTWSCQRLTLIPPAGDSPHWMLFLMMTRSLSKAVG